MTNEHDDQSWRRREAPTHTQAEDTWLIGLSLKQILGIGIALAVAGAIYQFSPLAFFPQAVRIAVAGAFAAVGAGFIIIRPGGRNMFTIVKEQFSFLLASKEYPDLMEDTVSPEPQSEKEARDPETGSSSLGSAEEGAGWRKFVPNLPFLKGRSGGGIGTSVICLVLLGASTLGTFACGAREVSAQGAPEPYMGRRVFLQSIVVDLGMDGYRGGSSANIRVKSAAPIKTMEPRVNQSLQSVTETKAHNTRVFSANREHPYENGEAAGNAALRIPPLLNAQPGEEKAFDDIYLGAAGIRPYCDVRVKEDTLVITEVPALTGYAGHINSPDCRIRPPGNSVGPVDIESGLSKPYLTVNWIDRVQNTGALNIARALLPYPEPWMVNVDPIIGQGANGEIVINPHDLCNITEIRFLSLGIQTEKPDTPETYNYFGTLRSYARAPSGYSKSDGYFDGEPGKRIAGQIQTCFLNYSHQPLRSQEPISVILSETQVLGSNRTTDFDIKVRPMATTQDPDNDVVNTAKLVIENVDGSPIETIDIPASGDADFFGTGVGNYPTVRFNIDGSGLTPISADEPNKVKLRFKVELTHEITVERPIYQPVEFYPRRMETHISSCGCSESGSGDSCSCSSTSSTADYEYYPDHYRVAARDQDYLPGGTSSQVTIEVNQTIIFEDRVFQFDEPYQELVYVRPTPEPGELREPEYFEYGALLGLQGTMYTPAHRRYLYCDEDLNDRTVYPTPPGWKYIPETTNSKGETYGHKCRRDYHCCILIPKVEEACSVPPTEEEWECPYKRE